MSINSEMVAKNVAALQPCLSTLEKQAQGKKSKDQERKERLDKLFRQSFVDVNHLYEAECNLLTYGNVDFLAVGDIHAVKAKQKQGKTHLLAIFATALLKGEFLGIRSLVSTPRILYYDTEQKPRDCQKIAIKVLTMSGFVVPGGDFRNNDNFRAVSVRGFDLADKRQLFLMHIDDYRPKLVLLDGVVDLVSDYNDQAECSQYITELMRISLEYKCAIICVLHENKADNNMRGVLGTLLAQKSGYVFDCHKEGSVISVTNEDSRGAQVPPFYFCFDEQGNIIEGFDIVAKQKDSEKNARIERSKATNQAKKEDVLSNICSFVQECETGIERKRLISDLSKTGICCKSSAYSHISSLIKAGRLLQSNKSGKTVISCNMN